jgi:hypothetical protein
MRAKRAERAIARQLRADGRSLREISRELGVSLSSASVWTRDVPVPAPLKTPEVVIRWQPVRLCNACGRLLFGSRFHRGQSRCKDCRREYMRRRGDLHRQQSRRARDKRRAAAREYVIQILRTGACADCGLTDPAVLEFDHVGPKWTEVGKLVREAYRLERIKAEIANCELVCANCHRRRTARRIRSLAAGLGLEDLALHPSSPAKEPALSPRLPTDCALHRLRRDRSSGPGLRPRGPEACWRCPTGRQGARHRLSGTGDCAVRGAVRKLPQATDYRRAGALPQSSCCAPVAQRLELAPFKRKVGGSSPPGGTRRCDAAARAAPGRRCPASPRAPLPADRGSGCSGRPRGGRAVGGGLRGGF